MKIKYINVLTTAAGFAGGLAIWYYLKKGNKPSMPPSTSIDEIAESVITETDNFSEDTAFTPGTSEAILDKMDKGSAEELKKELE
tara:strand:+ start:9524 stop:9778 length:255 start_codon:yes stop_codon:yes gene_type:complete